MSPSKTTPTAAAVGTVTVSSPPMNPSTEQNSLPPAVTPSLPTTAPGALLEVKDRRAFEHDRQRAHKPLDRYLSKRLKPPRHRTGNSGRSAKAFPGYRASLRPWEGVVSTADIDVGDVKEPYYYLDEDENRVGDDEPVRPLHVSLSDLIRPPRKRNGISQGFEFIPRLRPVMVMEDGSEFVDDEEEEDDTLDWEVVRVSGAKREVSARQSMPKKSSYAAVLRASSISKT
ncbi:hypothetical protein BS47DRAFT_1387812 [Hydnum rufescens UP504]|uniref:Uncharacterized protein n=1 Tax=Hydnum rufescens UP504 TaxID=1448309 RepID=A0A9P6B8T1_9AGAM|nr:hypothetical protein BS47DRAFT_1387812 [Hydnum rufescens UP504]